MILNKDKKKQTKRLLVVILLNDIFMKITIPTDLSEIKLSQYLRYSKVLEDNQEDETFIAIQMVSIFCKMKIEDVMKIPAYDFAEIVEHLGEVLKQKPALVRTFKLNGVNYGFVPNFDDESIGTYAFIDSHLGSQENWSKLMSAMYRPITKKVGQLYDIGKFEGDKYSEEFFDIRMDCVVGAVLFFWTLKIELLNNIMAYSEQVATTDKNLEAVEIFSTAGVGITQLSKLREEIILTSNELKQQTYILRLPSFCI
jgi:hypothetical protein